MTVARSVADVLSEHVRFEVECIDRMYLNVYVPQLQYAAGLIGYLHRQLGLPIASTAPLAKITDAFSAAVHRFARVNGVAWVDFAKGQRKDDVMHEHLAEFTGTEGVLFIGRAQEKTAVFRTEKRRDAHGDSYPWIVKSTGMVNHFYFYCLDADFGPFFLKFCSYFPYNAKLCLNGNEWAKRQAAKAGIGFERAGQRVRRGRRSGGAAGDLRPVGARADRRAAAQVAGHPAAPVQSRGSGRRLPLRPVDPAGRVLADPDARRPGVGPGLLRAGHPRQPRHRPPRSGRSDLRPATAPARTPRHPGPVPDPGDHRRGHPEPARGLQAHHASSSTTRKEKPYGPRPPSTTPAISGSGND